MASNAIIPYGGSFEQSTDGITYVDIPEIKGIPIPTSMTEYLDVTSLDSTNRRREYIAGLIDSAELPVVANYTSAGFAQQKAAQDSGDLMYYRATLPPNPVQSTGDQFVFRGFPSVEPDLSDIAAPGTMTITFKISGDPTFTAGS